MLLRTIHFIWSQLHALFIQYTIFMSFDLLRKIVKLDIKSNDLILKLCRVFFVLIIKRD